MSHYITTKNVWTCPIILRQKNVSTCPILQHKRDYREEDLGYIKGESRNNKGRVSGSRQSRKSYILGISGQ